MTAAELPQDVLTRMPAPTAVVVLFRCTTCREQGEDARQPYPVCLCFAKHETLVVVGGPRGCTCGRCELFENGLATRCAGSLMAWLNREGLS